MKLNSIRIALLALMVLFFVGCHNPYKSGLEALSEGNYTEAEKNAREVLREDPQNPEYNLLLADALVGREEYKQAESHAEKAFAADHLKGSAGRTLGKILWELGQPIGAVDAWRAARAADKSSVLDEDYIRALETALNAAGAVRDFETALVLRTELKGFLPDHLEVQPESFRKNKEEYADELVRDGRVQDAIAVYGNLSEEFGDHEYQFERGRLYAHLGEEGAATEAFQLYVNSAESMTDKTERMLQVASRAERLGAMTVAVQFYDQAIAGMPKASVRRAKLHRTLAVLFLAAQMTDQGSTHLSMFLADMAEARGGKAAAKDFVDAANSASANRAPQLAIAFLEEAIAVAQPNWKVSRTLADLYIRRARQQDVERVLNLYVDRSESPSRAKIRVGRWASTRRNYDLAKHYLEAAVEDKVPTSVWLDLARVYAALGLSQDLVRSLKTYAKLNDDKRRAYLNIAGIYRSQRMYEEAESALKVLIKRDPKEPHYARQLETLYREWGRPNKIHDVYAKWLRARGDKADDYQMVGERFLRQNEWDDALPYLKKAAERGDNDAWLQVADIYKRQRKERDMKAALDSYLSKADNRVAALQMVWQRYRTSAWGHEAIPFLEELISLEPHNVVHYEQLSELFFEQGREVEAFELWKRYIEYSNNPIASLESMGRRFERRGLYDWMLAFLHQLLDKNPKPDPELYRLLGNAYYAKLTRRSRTVRVPDNNAIFSQENKATEYYEKYLTIGEPKGRDLEKFASAMHRKRVWDVAAKAYEQLDLSAPMSAHRLLEYGSVLLNLGRSEEASKVLSEYFKKRGGSVDAARAVADEMASASQYDAMEPYLMKMMDSGDENLIRAAFMQLSEVYRQTDRGDEIGRLANDYLAKTQNPGDARRNVLNVMEGAGRWEDAVRQLERIASIQGDEFKYEFGVALFRHGDDDRAESEFRDFASNNVVSGEAWLRVAQFYESHARGELAEEAYDMAVSGAPANDAVLVERGRFRILRGRIEDGRGDMEEARSHVDQARRWPIWKAEVQALKRVGQHEQARHAARDALSLAFVEREFFYRVIAESELSSGDAVRAQRMVDELMGAGLPADVLASVLYRYGFLEDLTI